MDGREARRLFLESIIYNPPADTPVEIKPSDRPRVTPDVIITPEQVARAYRPELRFKPRVAFIGKNVNPSSAATSTNAEVEGGSKGPASDPSEPTGIKAEGMHNYPLKSQPSSESLVVDLNPAPDSAAETASTAGTKAEVQGGSLLKRPCEVLGESSEILREIKKQMVPKGN